MAGRYNFEFFRHKCGQTLSIYDTEPCICEMPGYVDPKFLQQETTVEKATATMRSLRRLLRRAGRAGHKPMFVIYAPKQAEVLFAGRHIRVRDDGSYVQNMIPHSLAEQTPRCDPHCMSALERRVMFGELNWASECRRRGWHHEARRAVEHVIRNRQVAV